MKIVRTEAWPLNHSAEQSADLDRTVALYRRYVRGLMSVMMAHWPALAEYDDIVRRTEALIHPTKQRPRVRYRYFHLRFYKFPSYLRRVAINDAYGQVASFMTRYGRWLDGERRQANEKPPTLTLATQTWPALYKGQCIRYDDTLQRAAIKVFNGSDWVWTLLRIHSTGRRTEDVKAKRLSPLLVKVRGRYRLNVPFEKKVALPAGDADVVCAVDVGINTQATASIVRRDGTVVARCFLHRAADNDRLRRRLDRIRRKAKQTKNLSPGFCRQTYRKAFAIARNSAHHLSRELVRFAQAHGATVIVFEHLKGWRPRGGRKRSGLKQRFHTWHHRRLVEYTTAKWHEAGGRLAFVSPYQTSKQAFDGSGEVKRDPHNAALAIFPNGKRYNADLNASYNIAAKYFLRARREAQSARSGKSSRRVPGTPVTLSALWQQKAA